MLCFGVGGYCGPFLYCCDFELGEEDIWLLLYSYCNITNMRRREKYSSHLSGGCRWRHIFHVNKRPIGVHGLSSRWATIFNVMVAPMGPAPPLWRNLSEGEEFELKVANRKLNLRYGRAEEEKGWHTKHLQIWFYMDWLMIHNWWGDGWATVARLSGLVTILPCDQIWWTELATVWS